MGRTDMRALWTLLRGHRVRFATGIGFLGLQSAALLPITLLVHNIFAIQIPAANSRAVLISGLGVLALFTASALLSLLARRIILIGLFKSVSTLRRQVLARLHDLPLAWHERQDIGRLHAALVLDGERLEASLPSIVMVAQAIVVGVPLTVVAIVVSPLLAGVAALIAVALLVLNSRLKQRTEEAIKRWMGTHRAYAGHVLGTLRSMRLIRTRGVDEIEQADGDKRVLALEANSFGKAWASSVATIVNGAIAGIAGSIILVVGGVAASTGALSIGTLMAFYAVLILLLRSVTGAAGAGSSLMVAAAALAPLQTIVADPLPPVYSGCRREPFDGSVALRGVTFGYRTAPVLRAFDFEIASGERVAVIGENGSGKSTLARLVLGLDRPWSGEVIMCGHRLDELDVAALRRQIGVVLQETIIRAGTIRENVAFGRPDLTTAQVERALSLAGITDMLDHRFPDGVDTDVGDDGSRLSGGQRQAISLARALLGDPRLLILDEPTNHLDSASIARLQDAVDTMDPPPAVLIITHDPAIAGWADRVVRLESGDVTTESLMAERP
ncbi:ATP-binding cassette subfamily B protein [Mycolicibacterium sp. BK634]|uniref:ABC transporter ATP-binding protein n=1 Tax=Mycolicibacterium sp. BK634 TaxID=2587099 RepID=UPI00161E295B|nr:ABC transporter ATP-binding protein [Mycolicibacterium sp. BK634]MBB3748114.1 ATP-binding cassette subfamily B protein [Mycolicibacterium sp. BK634]